MKRFTLGLVLCGIFVSASLVSAADAKFGFVDVQKILLSSETGKEAKEQLSTRAGKYEGEKNSREDELKKLKGELEKQSVLLSESARSAKERDYQQKLKEYQRFMKDAQDDLQAKNEELTSRIVDDIVKVIQEYGRTNGFTFIFVRNDSMIYADDKADQTEAVLKMFNSGKKK